MWTDSDKADPYSCQSDQLRVGTLNPKFKTQKPTYKIPKTLHNRIFGRAWYDSQVRPIRFTELTPNLVSSPLEGDTCGYHHALDTRSPSFKRQDRLEQLARRQEKRSLIAESHNWGQTAIRERALSSSVSELPSTQG